MLYVLLLLFLVSELPTTKEPAAPFELGSEIEADVGGLVVCHVLRRDAVAIDWVLQERVEAIRRGQRRDIEAKVAAVAGAGKHFLAPVTYDVGSQARVALCAVVELAAVEARKGFDRTRAGEVEGLPRQRFF